MHKLIATVVVTSALCLPAMTGPTQAQSLGTAGPLRSVGYANCGVDLAQQIRGACDPAPVDPALAPSERSRGHVERALKLFSFLRMSQARDALNAALAADPNNIEALKLRARSRIPDNIVAAHADINAGLLLSPNDAGLLATRAYLLRGEGDLAQALVSATAAVKSAPKDADARWIRARILMDLDKMHAAVDDLTHAIRIEPNHGLARMARAKLNLSVGRFREAVTDATAVLGGPSHDPLALQFRAAAPAALGEYDAAIADLTTLLGAPGVGAPPQATPESLIRLAMQRASLLVQTGRTAEAMNDLDMAVRAGGRKAVLIIQLHLRRHGFPDVPIDGQRSTMFDEAIIACFRNQACGRGVSETL
jgi:tetratricopeptide (TPR) repeat protein